MSDTDNIYENQRKLLEVILSDDACDLALRDLIEAELRKVPALTLAKEMEIYERLNKAIDVEAREELIDYFSSFAITGAWPFRNLGVPLIDLIGAARRAIVLAAYSFSALKTNSFHRCATNVVEQSVLDRLDQCEVENVSPQEVQQLMREGNHKSASEILELLSFWEIYMIEAECGKFAEN